AHGAVLAYDGPGRHAASPVQYWQSVAYRPAVLPAIGLHGRSSQPLAGRAPAMIAQFSGLPPVPPLLGSPVSQLAYDVDVNGVPPTQTNLPSMAWSVRPMCVSRLPTRFSAVMSIWALRRIARCAPSPMHVFVASLKLFGATNMTRHEPSAAVTFLSPPAQSR